MLIVPSPSAAAVARHYNLDARKFRAWLRQQWGPNHQLIGAIDSPALRQEVRNYRAGYSEYLVQLARFTHRCWAKSEQHAFEQAERAFIEKHNHGRFKQIKIETKRNGRWVAVS